jgi:hypothetical protein
MKKQLCLLLLVLFNLGAMDDTPAGYFSVYDTEDIARLYFIQDNYDSIRTFFSDFKNETPTQINDVFAELIIQIYEKEQHILHFMSMYQHLPLHIVDRLYVILYEYNQMKRYLMDM